MAQYSFAPGFGRISVDAGQLNAAAGSSFSISGADASNPVTRPPIGAEIGPDPRNGTCRFTLPTVPTQEAVNGVRFDFNHGYRFYFPANSDYILRICDNRSGLEMLRQRVQGENGITGEAKFFIDYHIELLEPESGKVLFSHDFNPAGKRVNIAIPDGGLGDNFAWLPYPEEFRKKYNADVYCPSGEWLGRLVGDLYPEIKFIRFDEMKQEDTPYASYFCAIFRPDRLSWRPIPHQYLGMQRSVASILGLPLEEVIPRVHLEAPREIKEPYVCISAQATNPCKYWNFPGGWDEIIEHLNSIGYRVLCIDRESRLVHKGKAYCKPEKAEDFTGCLPIQQRIDLLHHADFFIGLPSGLSWVAWASRTPVVMISGFTLDPCEFYTPYRVTNYLVCNGCWNDSTVFFDGTLPEWCPRHLGTPRQFECTRMISTKMVMDTIKNIPAYQEQLRKHNAASSGNGEAGEKAEK